MSKLNGNDLAKFAKSKLGTNYVYGTKMEILDDVKLNILAKEYPSVFTTSYINKAKKFIGKECTDCSGLISAYTKKLLGSAQLYSSAKKRMKIDTWKDWAVGVVLWKSGHVGVYIGDGYVIEARGIDYGTVKTKITDRGWKYGLTFDYIDYTYTKKVTGTTKKNNPYKIPTSVLLKGSTGQGVKWLQFELNESGANLEVDGIFGNKTRDALKKFQKSSKIKVDGICGSETRKALLAN